MNYIAILTPAYSLNPWSRGLEFYKFGRWIIGHYNYAFIFSPARVEVEKIFLFRNWSILGSFDPSNEALGVVK